MRWLRKLLLPFSLIYGLVLRIRHFAYDVGVFPSASFPFPVICVGNLRVGGTGKTPMTEYLATSLKEHHKTAILSRGYGRKTSGFLVACSGMGVRELGDEPFQYARKLKGVTVAVDENRKRGISRLRDTADIEVVILDDALQHRKVAPGLSMLLTAYGDLYVDDMLLPAGNLRDLKYRASAADLLVVTKCPADLTASQMKELKSRLKPEGKQQIFFTTIEYSDYTGGAEIVALETLKQKQLVLITGIADPSPLVRYLQSSGFDFMHKAYADHHEFSEKEIRLFQTYRDSGKVLLTTEKDYTRLSEKIEGVLYLPIRIGFLEDQQGFENRINEFVTQQ
ncbi:tetraacyldisaccharide 4'-kinase [Robertkochia aurantiaca]|uniref:tetraacyldisaccharide 4'-kinase n=1 Tax=Robertkochia aurantiaca TaxID=2873700 RepID=UPI001CCF5373|nr:tetraacyldisaccharide 4'-kinase [Robertkochia sp. 3YJGBD-33]